MAAERLSQLAKEIRQLIQSGRLADAWGKCGNELQSHPDDAELHLLAGQVQYLSGRPDVAEGFLNRAIVLEPESVGAYHLLSVLLDRARRKDEALRVARRANELAPDNAEICANLGALLTGTDDFNAAEPYLLRATELDAGRGLFFDSLGNLYRKQLRHEESLEAYLRAVSLEPDSVAFRMHAIKAWDCRPETDPVQAFEFIRAAGEMVQERWPAGRPRKRQGAGPLRLGYLGSTLRRHSVTFFLLPVLENHSDRFEVFTYNAGHKEDATTDRIRAASTGYRHVHGIGPDEIAARIAADGIDILFDLDGYTEAGTIQVLARKPAPVQIAWIGCPGTLGMSRVDYRIVDCFTDPVDGIADGIHSERLIRMPTCFSVYSPPGRSPDVTDTPARRNGHVTFGSFNVPTKMNDRVIHAWADILLAVPDSILVLKTPLFEQASMRDNVTAAFAARGVNRDRLRFLGFDADGYDHLQRYAEVDIALDPFPYNGTTTTCDALWMGVPVITLAGDRHISRVGVSLLNSVGLPELIARDTGDYVRIARELAGDIEALNRLRQGLRQRMSGSPLLDGATFTAQLESELDRIWRDAGPTSR